MIATLAALAFIAAHDPARPAQPDPLAPPKPVSTGQTTTVAPVTAEAQIIYGVIEGKGQAKPKKVCFNDPVLGSKIPSKRCIDRTEFEQRQLEARDEIYRIQSDVRAR